MTRHLPSPRDSMIVTPIHGPYTGADGLERLITPRCAHSIVDNGAILAQGNYLIVAERVGMPRLELFTLQHLVD